MKKGVISFILLLLLSFPLRSQDLEYPLFYPLKQQFLSQATFNGDSIFPTYQSNYTEQLSSLENIDYVRIDSSKSGSWLGRKLLRENFLILDQKNIYLTVDPLFNFTYGQEKIDDTVNQLYQNTRGIKIEGVLGDKFVFHTSFLENQARFPTYLNTFVENNGVVPGMGRVKEFNGDDWDYAMSTASISWKINKIVRVKLGNDKDFLGLGYRSILLSDNSFNYPHLKVDLFLFKGKIKYTMNVALLQDLIRLPPGETPESLFQRKAGSFHYLTYKPINKIEIGLFSGVILPSEYSTEDSYLLDAFNPIIFTNIKKKYINRVGLNAAWQFCKKGLVYGQFANTVYKNDEWAYQLGVQFSHLIKNLYLTLEYSSAQSISNSGLEYSYSHYSQSLGHTLGSGFSEIYFRLNYNYKRFHFMTSINSASRNVSDALLWGFIDFRNENSSNVYTSTFINSEFIYMLNIKTNMNIAFGYQLRKSTYIGEVKSDYLYLSFRTSIFNEYRDF